MAKRKDVIEIIEVNTILETKYEFVSKQNDDLRNQIAELESTIKKLQAEKEELETVSEETKEDFRRLIQYLNNKYELNFVLNDKLEVMDLKF